MSRYLVEQAAVAVALVEQITNRFARQGILATSNPASPTRSHESVSGAIISWGQDVANCTVFVRFAWRASQAPYDTAFFGVYFTDIDSGWRLQSYSTMPLPELAVVTSVAYGGMGTREPPRALPGALLVSEDRVWSLLNYMVTLLRQYEESILPPSNVC